MMSNVMMANNQCKKKCLQNSVLWFSNHALLGGVLSCLVFAKFAGRNRQLETMSVMPIIRVRSSGVQIFKSYAVLMRNREQ